MADDHTAPPQLSLDDIRAEIQARMLGMYGSKAALSDEELEEAAETIHAAVTGQERPRRIRRERDTSHGAYEVRW